MKRFSTLNLSIFFKAAGVVIATLIICTAFIPHASAAEIHVYPENDIQTAIDTAGNGDVIILHPGIYYKNIVFKGKAVTVKSTDPNDSAVVATTVIDGNQAGSVIRFENGEGSDTVLSGISILHGKRGWGGGGIHCASSSPTITKCIISANSSTGGAGIGCFSFANPSIIN